MLRSITSYVGILNLTVGMARAVAVLIMKMRLIVRRIAVFAEMAIANLLVGKIKATATWIAPETAEIDGARGIAARRTRLVLRTASKLLV